MLIPLLNYFSISCESRHSTFSSIQVQNEQLHCFLSLTFHTFLFFIKFEFSWLIFYLYLKNQTAMYKYRDVEPSRYFSSFVPLFHSRISLFFPHSLPTQSGDGGVGGICQCAHTLNLNSFH